MKRVRFLCTVLYSYESQDQVVMMKVSPTRYKKDCIGLRRELTEKLKEKHPSSYTFIGIIEVKPY